MKKLVIAMCSVSSLALSMPVYAAEADASDSESASSSDEMITVFARRREESSQDVPVVVDTVTSNDIANLNLQNFAEIQSLVPGLQLFTNDNGIGSNAQIRGVAFDINASTQPTVEFYLNDSVVNSSAVLQQMYDIGQIEVQRGPQGTLRGRASPSGSITVTTKKPDLERIGANASISISDTNTRNINGAIGVPVIEGVLGLRVAGLWSEGEGNRVKTIDTDLTSRGPHSRSKSARVSALFVPTDWLRLEGVYQHGDQRSRSFSQYASFSLVNSTAPLSPVLIGPKDRLSIQETPRTFHQKFDIFNWRAEVRFGGQVLIYQGQTEKSTVNSRSPSDSAEFLNGFDHAQTTLSRSKATSHEIRLQNEERVLGMFDYVVGYFNWKRYSPTSLTIQTPVVLPPFAGGSLVAVADTGILTAGNIKENSFFGNVIAHIGDKFQLSGGLRHVNFKSPAGVLTIGANQLPGAAKVDDSKLIYTASAQYFINPDVMVYASTGTSRRPGPTIVGNFSPIQSDLQRSFTYLKSEDSTSYELGLKSTFFNRRVRFNITGYHQKFTNYPYKLSSPVFIQTFQFNGTGFTPGVGSSAQFAANVPLEVNGVEVEVGVKVTDNFNIDVVASYSKGKIKNGLIPCNDLNGDGVPDNLTAAPTLAQIQAAYGNDFIGACRVSQRSSGQPPFSATVEASYNVPISDRLDFFTRGLLTLQGNSLGDPTNAFDSVGSYGLLNLFAGIRASDGAWEVNFFAKNILNTTKTIEFGAPAVTTYQELQPPTFMTTAGKSFTSTYSQIRTTAPREFGVNLRFAFGSR